MCVYFLIQANVMKQCKVIICFVFYIDRHNLKLLLVFIHFLEREISINTGCSILIRTDKKGLDKFCLHLVF